MREISAGSSSGGGGLTIETTTQGNTSLKFDENIAKEMLNEARIIARLHTVEPSEDKRLIILGGQPASGKSSITKELFEQYKDNIVLLNGDEFKPLYPNYKDLAKADPDGTSKLVQPYSNYVVDNLKQEAIERGVNVIVEGTMRTSEVPLKTADEFASKGYTVEAYVVSSSYYNSRIGIEHRYENEVADKGYGRMVNVANHDEAYNNIPNTLQELANSGKFANITIATRDGNSIAETSLGDDIVKAYTNHRDNFTLDIYLDVTDRINEVEKLMTARGASQTEFEKLTGIKSSLDNAFDKEIFQPLREPSHKLENTHTSEKEAKEIASTVMHFDAKATINEVLNRFEKYDPHLVEDIRNSNTIKYLDTDLSLNHLDAKTVAEYLSDKTNGKVGIEFEQQEKSKGYER